ncbi:MAG: kelch repeat-containing protein [Planctomycetota bacterium]
MMPRLMALALALACAATMAAGATVPTGEMTVPANQWTKVADCPPDPLARELQPGRGAFWCFDPASARFHRYGGYTPTDSNSLWTFDLGERAWANPLKVDYSWPPPSDRPGAGAWWSMAYDAKREVIWIHGGAGLAGRHHPELFHDIWQYHPATGAFEPMKSKNWPRYGVRIVYDSKNDLVIREPAYAGEWSARHNKGRTWVYNPKTNKWAGRPTKGSPGPAKAGVWVFDESVGVCVFLGLTKDGSPGPTWTYDAGTNTWAKLDCETGPPARVYAGATYHPEHERVIVYGGIGKGGKGYGYAHRGGGVVLHDTWALDTDKAAWTKLDVGRPAIPKLPGDSKGRFVLRIAMDYDRANKAVVVSAPTFGVWVLRYRPEGAKNTDPLSLAELTPFESPEAPEEPVFPKAEPNKKLLELEPNKWVKLGGGRAIGGGEVPMTYDAATGFALKYGGCNDGGTTFASGYGNDLSAYDPATERWIALRWVDPCGPPRPANGCTRFYACDPVRKVTWFAGGTAGNRLARSLPTGWPGGSGTWKYDGVKDRFELVPSKGKKPAPGVACCWDPDHGLFVCNTKRGWGDTTVRQFDPAKRQWTAGPRPRARAYTYGTHVPPLKGMLVVEPGKKGNTTLLYDPAKKAWRELKPDPELPKVKGRPTPAYDPEHRVVICLLGGRTFVFDVEKNAWSELDTNKPGKATEMLCWDARHKVLLATHNMGGRMWAFRYSPE